jgi:hypothetical protein
MRRNRTSESRQLQDEVGGVAPADLFLGGLGMSAQILERR